MAVFAFVEIETIIEPAAMEQLLNFKLGRHHITDCISYRFYAPPVD